ncbi:MAG: hypothetical protein NVSMB32_07590 [Actinomycetota bacterium]
MLVYMNGNPMEVPEGRRLLDLLADAGLGDLRGVAIAIDGEVLPRSEWPPAIVADGQQLEVLRAVQGGSS